MITRHHTVVTFCFISQRCLVKTREPPENQRTREPKNQTKEPMTETGMPIRIHEQSTESLLTTVNHSHDSDIEPYLRFCQTTTAKRHYRNSLHMRTLHRRTMIIGLLGTPELRHRLWQPLLDLNAVPVLEELLVLIRNRQAVRFDTATVDKLVREFFATDHRGIQTLILNPSIRTTCKKWVDTVLVPCSDDPTPFSELWITVIEPIWDAAAVTIYARATQRLDGFRWELLETTWHPDRVMNWCF